MTEKISKAQQRRDAKLQRHTEAEAAPASATEQDPPGTIRCIACGCKTVRPTPPACGH